jgi:hypothetical protein
MTDEAQERQLERFGEAVEQKKEEAREASEHPGAGPTADGASPVTAEDEQAPLVDRAHQQDDRDVRAKNSGHGKKTADKWNQ